MSTSGPQPTTPAPAVGRGAPPRCRRARRRRPRAAGAVPGVVRPGAGGGAGRRELAGAGLPGGRRDAPVHGVRLRRLPDRRGRSHVRGPGRLVGPDDPGPCRPRGSSQRSSDAVGRGFSFGTPGPAEVELAEEIVARVAPVDLVRLVSSGTEASMSAIRLARGFTGRPLVVKFAGLLPRPRRLAARRGRVGGGHPRAARLPGRHRRTGRRHGRPALQRPRPRSRRCSPSVGRRSQR